MPVRRLLPFVLVNIVVSAVVVLAILFWWDSRQSEAEVVQPSPTRVISLQTGVTPSGPLVQEQATEVPDEEGPPTYAVQAGDTLGKISRDFDVSVEDLMAANGLDNPDFLQVGQVLIVPVGGISEATPTPTSTASPEFTPSPISADLPSEGEAVAEITESIGVGSVIEEAVSIANSGSRPIALLGWRLQDEDGHAYTFGQVTLFGEGAAILVHTGAGQDGPSDLYWGLQEAVWRAGETITLLDSEGTVRATYIVTNQ